MRTLSAVPHSRATSDSPVSDSVSFLSRTLTAVDGTSIEISTSTSPESAPCSVIRVVGPGAAGEVSELAVESLAALQALVESDMLTSLLAAHRAASKEAPHR